MVHLGGAQSPTQNSKNYPVPAPHQIKWHETGFAIYQSDINPYGLKVLKWRNGKGDIVGDFVKSCRKYGVQAGRVF